MHVSQAEATVRGLPLPGLSTSIQRAGEPEQAGRLKRRLVTDNAKQETSFPSTVTDTKWMRCAVAVNGWGEEEVRETVYS